MNTVAHPPHSPHSPHSILAAGERLPQLQLRETWAGPNVQRVLFSARQRFGHALCTCRPQVLKLQIRLRDEKCHLAVWPQEGPLHDSECMFFHDELADQASPVGMLRAAVQPAVALLPAPAPPRLGLAYSPAASSARMPPALTGARTADPSIVNVKALAQRLWEAAALCRWHSSWTRDWGRTRYQLHQGAREFTLNGKPLETLLFVPRPYREAAAHALDREWDGFVRNLQVERPGQPRLLIAPLRRLNPPRDDRPPTVLLRHLRVPIGLSGPCYEFIWRTCRNSLSNSWLGGAGSQAGHEPGEASTWTRRPEVMGFFLVEGSSREGLWARAAWLLPVHPTIFIPAANSDMVQLIDQLVAGRYSFQHIPSDVAASRRTSPDLLVRHVRGPDGAAVARAALEVLSAGATADHLAARAAIAQRLAAHRVPTWVWSPVGHRPDRSVPPLPPLDQVADVTSAEVLRRIEESPQADYRYGLSSKLFNHERKVS